jgi:3'-phosphoadenosine 5'-phosphosulfate sulfotransferase (PAPS reductase)/FAD synthetase
MSSPLRLTHLERLEAESVHIPREVVAECETPVMLYSIGKDRCCCTRRNSPCEHPEAAELVNDTTRVSAEQAAEQTVATLTRAGILVEPGAGLP